MGYIGKKPTPVPLTASDVTDGIITSAKIADGTIASADLATGVGGKVLQVVSTAKSDTYSESVAANTMSSTDITGLSASITPASSSNKILIIASLATGRNSNDTNSGVGIAMFRGGTLVGVGDTASSRTRLSSMSHHASDLNITTVPINFLDSPSTTSSTTYTFRFLNSDGDTSNLYLNRSANDADGSHIGRCISTVTLIEVSA